MKKILILSILALFAFAPSFGQRILTKQFAFGAKGIDSAVQGTVAYYYVNGSTYGTVKASAPITNSKIGSIQVVATPSVKSSRIPDSTNIEWQYSLDNTNWVKWGINGATSSAYVYSYYNGGPQAFGTAAAYRWAADYISQITNTGGGVFAPRDCYAPYVRVKCTVNKASCTAYITAWVTFLQ